MKFAATTKARLRNRDLGGHGNVEHLKIYGRIPMTHDEASERFGVDKRILKELYPAGVSVTGMQMRLRQSREEIKEDNMRLLASLWMRVRKNASNGGLEELERAAKNFQDKWKDYDVDSIMFWTPKSMPIAFFEDAMVYTRAYSGRSGMVKLISEKLERDWPLPWVKWVYDTVGDYRRPLPPPDVMAKVMGKSFRCHCGGNVFRHPPGLPDVYQCNSCTERYIGE